MSRTVAIVAFVELPLVYTRESADVRAWLERVPALVEACAEQWRLDVGDPFPYAFTSIALACTRADGEPVVLKLQCPDRESEHEAAALGCWDGDGAVRLLDHDSSRHALLLERCLPGSTLAELPADEALDVLVALLPRLWRPAGAPFTPLADEAAWWAGYLPERWERAGCPFERRLLDAALDALDTLPSTQGEQVLLSQDLHADNVLRAEREPWLVIDPKPLVGERELGLAPVVRGAELGHSPEAVRARLDRLSGELGLDRERVRGWTIAQTLAWAFDGDAVRAGSVDVARWLLET
jgi:streptomycin 6-kinase